MILLALLGCLGYSEGQEKRGELNCEWLEACGNLEPLGYADVGACKEAAAAQPYSDDDCPDYDGGQMGECLDAYRDAVDAADCEADFADVCQVCG